MAGSHLPPGERRAQAWAIAAVRDEAPFRQGAVIIIVLDAHPGSFWRIDVEPLCLARLQAHSGRWTLRSLGH